MHRLLSSVDRAEKGRGFATDPSAVSDSNRYFILVQRSIRLDYSTDASPITGVGSIDCSL